MSFMVGMNTDVGIRKETNQDSLCIKEAQTNNGNLLLAVVCDGMGGLERGEVASAAVIKAFSEWFDNKLAYQLPGQNYMGDISYCWERLIKEQNQNIAEYGRKAHIQLGTTVTAMLFFENGKYLIAHVGDSRAYRVTDKTAEKLTEDHTLVAREVKKGNLTPEQAENDPRRNVLLQCVGASRIVEPDMIVGEYSEGECYMLCSDGFRHVITEEEITAAFAPSISVSEKSMNENIIRMTELNKQRGETDNISAVLIKIV